MYIKHLNIHITKFDEHKYQIIGISGNIRVQLYFCHYVMILFMLSLSYCFPNVMVMRLRPTKRLVVDRANVKKIKCEDSDMKPKTAIITEKLEPFRLFM